MGRPTSERPSVSIQVRRSGGLILDTLLFGAALLWLGYLTVADQFGMNKFELEMLTVLTFLGCLALLPSWWIVRFHPAVARLSELRRREEMATTLVSTRAYLAGHLMRPVWTSALPLGLLYLGLLFVILIRFVLPEMRNSSDYWVLVWTVSIGSMVVTYPAFAISLMGFWFLRPRTGTAMALFTFGLILAYFLIYLIIIGLYGYVFPTGWESSAAVPFVLLSIGNVCGWVWYRRRIRSRLFCFD